jgi:hypothetical protein
MVKKINNILENVIFHQNLLDYFENLKGFIQTDNNGVKYNSQSQMINVIGKDKINIVDDYFDDTKIHSFDNVKFRVTTDHGSTWGRYQIALDDNNKIINISNKLLSYFTIVNYPAFNSDHILSGYNNLINNNEFIFIDEEVFLFFDCFPFAPVHNLDDTYNLLYFYKKNNLKCKLLVINTDNFYYNQTLISLKKYFNLEYIYIDLDKNYKFKKFNCVRPHHWIQPEALDYIKENYVNKILEDNKGKPTYDNISIIKIGHPTNCSGVDTFSMTDEFLTLCKEKNIFDLNTLIDDIEYKIYVVNNAKNIIASYLSPFNVNIHKHCISTKEKNFLILNGGYGGSVENQFTKIDENKYDFYGEEINGIVIDERIDLSDVKKFINF